MTDEQDRERNEALAPLQHSPLEGTAVDGVAALAHMPEAEFEQKLAALKAGQNRIARVKKEIMTEGVHFGIIPGTDKPALYQPGAQLLCQLYGLRATFDQDITYGDQIDTPAVRCVTLCRLHVGDTEGPVVATGNGAANTWERKHRYRRGDRVCPTCGNVGAVIKGKANYGGGWICWDKKGGCGARFKDGDESIEKQAVGDIENIDQADLENTVIKMSEKRAYIGATLRGTASSDLFTQEHPDDDKSRDREKKQRPPVQKPRSTNQPPPPADANGGGYEPLLQHHQDDGEIEELHQARALFTESDGITEGQQRRLFAIARGNGWNDAGVEDALAQKLTLANAGEIPKLGDAYAAIVGWFQTNAPEA